MKNCIKCNQEKPLNSFYTRKDAKDGKDYYCKECRKAYSTLSHLTNKNPCTWNECPRPHYAKGLCKIHYTRKALGYAMDNPKDGQHKYTNIKKKYKLEQEAYDKMANKGCQICTSKERLGVDHDHSCCSGKYTCGKCVRGVVCQSCNIALSKLEQGAIHSANAKKIQLLQYILDYELKKKSLA